MGGYPEEAKEFRVVAPGSELLLVLVGSVRADSEKGGGSIRDRLEGAVQEQAIEGKGAKHPNKPQVPPGGDHTRGDKIAGLQVAFGGWAIPLHTQKGPQDPSCVRTVGAVGDGHKAALQPLCVPLW